MVRTILIIILLSFCGAPCLMAQDTVTKYNVPIHFSKVQLVAPLTLTLSGLILSGEAKNEVMNWRNNNLPNFHYKADDFLALSPIAMAYGLDVCGVKSRNDFWNRSAILCKGELMMLASVYLLKYTTKVSRPDGSDLYSFPSGHSAQAFMAATFLSQEYQQQLPWMPYAAYTIATSVAALRIANNKHYISDVLVGAALGILSQKIAYWTHQYRWRRRAQKPITLF